MQYTWGTRLGCDPGIGDQSLMTATAAQLTANRANALRSTGPRSPEGRSASRLNARKHGLRATAAALLPSESKEAWDALVAELHTDLNPEGGG